MAARRRTIGNVTVLAYSPGPAPEARDGGDVLLSRVAAGDADGLGLLYDRLSARVYGLLRAVIGDVSRADGTLLEVFEEVWRTAGQRRNVTGADAWVLSIALRRCRTHERAREMRLSSAEDDSQP